MSGIAFPLSGANHVDLIDKVSKQRHDQQHRVFGNRSVINARAEAERNAFGGAFCNVNFIDADSVLRDQLQSRQRLFDDGFGDDIIAAKKRIKVTGQFQHLRFGKRAAVPMNFGIC